jgi:hypothetical protein
MNKITFLVFVKNRYSGIRNFSQKVISEMSCPHELLTPKFSDWILIFKKKRILILNFPDISFKNIGDLACLLLAVLFGSKLKLIVHEYNSQSVYGKILLILLCFIAKDIYVVTPFLLDIIKHKVPFKINAKLVIQGSNISNVSSNDDSKRDKILFVGSYSNFIKQHVELVFNVLSSKEFLKYKIVWIGSKSKELDSFVRSSYSLLDIEFLDGIDESEFSKILYQGICAFFPFYDGFSARRSSLIASLTHGVTSIVSYSKYSSESMWLEKNILNGLILTNFDSKIDILNKLTKAIEHSKNNSIDIACQSLNIFSYSNIAKEIES